MRALTTRQEGRHARILSMKGLTYSKLCTMIMLSPSGKPSLNSEVFFSNVLLKWSDFPMLSSNTICSVKEHSKIPCRCAFGRVKAAMSFAPSGTGMVPGRESEHPPLKLGNNGKTHHFTLACCLNSLDTKCIRMYHDVSNKFCLN